MHNNSGMQTQLGRLLRQQRVRLGMRQDEAAVAAKMSPAYLANIERGEKRGPSADKLLRLALVLKLAPRRVFRVAMDARTEDLRVALAEYEAGLAEEAAS